jgi:hypothetical protein
MSERETKEERRLRLFRSIFVHGSPYTPGPASFFQRFSYDYPSKEQGVTLQ